jgi:hypothetical protein
MKRSATLPPQVVVRSIAFTPEALEALEGLCTTLAARTGKKASASAVVRALIRQYGKDPDIVANVLATIEEEQTSGTVWGKQARSR